MISVKPIFAWYDLWMGVFIDRPKRKAYIFLLPTLGIVIEWGLSANSEGDKHG